MIYRDVTVIYRHVSSFGLLFSIRALNYLCCFKGDCGGGRELSMLSECLRRASSTARWWTRVAEVSGRLLERGLQNMATQLKIVSVLVAIAVLGATPSGLGQTVTATLTGTVTDASGSAVPGAAVTLTNELSGDVRKTATSAVGYYSLPAIPAGTYSLSLEASGFQRYDVKGIVLNTSEERAVNVPMQVGSVNQAVEVSAAASQIETVTTGAQATTLSTKELQNVAIVGRSAAEYLKIMPGMASTNGTTNAPRFSGQVIGINGSGNAGTQSAVGGFSANGTPTASTEITSDGAHTSDPGCNCATPVNPNPEMLQEVHVLTTSFGAENAYGPTVINTVTKAGGTAFHGELYDSIRNYNLNSNDSANNAKGINGAGQPVAPRPPFVFNFPGGNIGGPVLIPGTHFNKNHDKLFFFSGFEYFHQQLATSTITTVVPTLAMRNGDFSPATIASLGLAQQVGGGLKSVNQAQFPGGMIPASIFDQGGKALLNLLPLPNADPNTTGGYNYVRQVPFSQNGWQMVHRLDYSISDSTKLFVRYYHQQELQVFPIAMWGGTGAPTGVPWPSPVYGNNRSESASVNLTHVFSPSLTNELVVGYTWIYFGNTLPNATAGEKGTVGYPYHGVFNNADPFIPDFNIGSTLVAMGQQGAFDIATKQYGGVYFAKKPLVSIGDNVAKILRSHTFRTGIYSEYYGNIQPPQGKAQGVIGESANNPTGTGNPFADLLIGNVASFQQVNFNPPVKIRSILVEFYVQDSWKVTKRLTVEGGMRFQHDPEGTDILGIGHAIFSPSLYASQCPGLSLGSCPNVYLPGFTWNKINPSVPLEGYPTPALYYSPRFGLAYDVFGSGKTVIRGGIGNYRYRGPSGGGGQPIGINLPTGSVSYTYPSSHGTTLKALDALVGSVFVSGQNSSYPSLPNPNSSQLQLVWTDNFGITQKLPWNSQIEASYVNTMGRQLPEIIFNNLNPVPYGAMLASPTANNQLYRHYQNYQDITLQAFDAYSDYNAFQVVFRHPGARYLLQANYTYSKVTGLNAIGSESTTGCCVTIGDGLNPKNDHGPLNFDRRQTFNIAYSVALPGLGDGANRLLRGAINGWTASGIEQIWSGANLQGATGTVGTEFGMSMPAGAPTQIGITGTPDVYVAPVLTCDPRKNLGPNQYLNPSCFALPTPGHNGTFVIPEAFGPGFFNTDLSLFKTFKFTENRSIQFRTEAFNILNHPNRSFGLDNNLNLTFNAAGVMTNSNFGTARLKTGFRIIQFVAKFYF